VPLLDTSWAILRRARSRSGVAVADKGHLHHRLMNLGHGQHRSVLILWVWTALLSAVVLYPTYTERGDALVPAGVVALAVLLYTFFAPGFRRSRHRGTGLNGPAAGGPSPSPDGVPAVPAAAPVPPAPALGPQVAPPGSSAPPPPPPLR
jgi:UDP-GlcNAc:undecaprenyl-phosphate GlcNAc-1-phosphate transferase